MSNRTNNLKVYSDKGMELNDYNGNGYYDIKDFVEAPNEEILEFNKGMKFDVILANPPYDRTLHIRFLEKFLDLANIIVSVQPSVWLTGQKKNRKICDIIDAYGANIESIKASDYFDAIIAQPMSINYINLINKSNIIYNGKEYKTCNDIDLNSNDSLLNIFRNNTNKLLTKNLMSELKVIPGAKIGRSNYEYNQNENEYIVKAAAIRGHGYSKGKSLNSDFYTLITNNYNIVNQYFIGKFSDIKNKPYKGYGLTYYWSFLTKNEAYNFYRYMQTDFCRICLYFSKNSPNLISGSIIRTIPWFDFSNEHFSKSPSEIDDYLFEKYIPEVDEETEITREQIREHIEKLLPDYYGIRH